MKEKVIISWSGGKDSALAFYEVKKNPNYEIIALLTVVTEDYDRVSMHGLRSVLLTKQVESLGLPLESVFISKIASQRMYESAICKILVRYKELGVSSCVFGDIFLEDVRLQREKNLSMIGMKAIFPLWKRDTSRLVSTFIKLGFKAIITCVDLKALDRSFLGKIFDERFLAQLPSDVDPCGENGEFHSFVYDGPIFHTPILHKIGGKLLRENRFYYCDVVPLAS